MSGSKLLQSRSSGGSWCAVVSTYSTMEGDKEKANSERVLVWSDPTDLLTQCDALGKVLPGILGT